MTTIELTRRISATEVKVHFERIVQEVAATDMPVIIQTQGQDQAVLISLRDFQKLHPSEEERPDTERERVRRVLRKAGLLSEPTAVMRQRATAYDVRYSPEEQEQLLAELRSLELEPPLSQVILENRAWYPTNVEPDNED